MVCLNAQNTYEIRKTFGCLTFQIFFLSLGFIRKITEGCLKSLVVLIQRWVFYFWLGLGGRLHLSIKLEFASSLILFWAWFVWFHKWGTSLALYLWKVISFLQQFLLNSISYVASFVLEWSSLLSQFLQSNFCTVWLAS
jgi:hypothetical protein